MSNKKEYFEEPLLPEIGKEYYCFDDGKIRLSRRYTVVVKEIKKLSDCSEEIKKLWADSIKDSPWLGWDRFKNPHIIITDNRKEENSIEYFAPACSIGYKEDNFIVLGNGDIFWFGINGWLNCGELDVDGSLNKLVEEQHEN